MANSGTTNYPQYCAWGSGTTAETVSDVALEKELSDPGKVANDSLTPSTTESLEIIGIAVSTAGSNLTFSETGLYNGSPAGSLFTHDTFGSFTKTTNEELQSIFSIKLR